MTERFFKLLLICKEFFSFLDSALSGTAQSQVECCPGQRRVKLKELSRTTQSQLERCPGQRRVTSRHKVYRDDIYKERKNNHMKKDGLQPLKKISFFTQVFSKEEYRTYANAKDEEFETPIRKKLFCDVKRLKSEGFVPKNR